MLKKAIELSSVVKINSLREKSTKIFKSHVNQIKMKNVFSLKLNEK